MKTGLIVIIGIMWVFMLALAYGLDAANKRIDHLYWQSGRGVDTEMHSMGGRNGYVS